MDKGVKLQLTFDDMDIYENEGCNLHYIEIHERDQEGRLLLHHCGTEKPGAIVATGALWIKFESGSQGTGRGFLASFNIRKLRTREQ